MFTGLSQTNTRAIVLGLLFPHVNNVKSYRCPSDKSQATLGGMKIDRVKLFHQQLHGGSGRLGHRRPTLPPQSQTHSSHSPRRVRRHHFVDEQESSIDDGHFGFNPDPTLLVWVNLPACKANRHSGQQHIHLCRRPFRRRKWVNPETLQLSGVNQPTSAPTIRICSLDEVAHGDGANEPDILGII